jgi:ankyrin repeat protein
MSTNLTNNAPASPQMSLQELYDSGLDKNSPSELKAALDLARNKSAALYYKLQEKALRAAVGRGLCLLTEYLLDTEAAETAIIEPHHVAKSISIPLLELLHSHGWDLNTVSDFEGQRLIDLALEQENIVQWLVEHGASVAEETETTQRPTTLLERCATHGSLSTFVYLQERGAKFGRMTLHRAAIRGAEAGADPSRSSDRDGAGDESKDDVQKQKKLEAEKILRYLVDIVGLDVNQIETDKPWLYGTPINHAASKPKGAGVVKWLLLKGADPTLYHKECPGENAEQIVRAKKYENTIEVLEEWRKAKMQSTS